MNTKIMITTILASMATLFACDSKESVDLRDYESCSIFVDDDLSVTDMMTGKMLAGPIIAVYTDTDIQCAAGVTIGDEPCSTGHGGELKFTPPTPGDGFSCSCVDANAVKWTQACSDPPYYGCTECCEGGGGETLRIKIYPNGEPNQCG